MKKILGTSLNNFSKKAFTVAEVLITMGIIGMVAEMTIPTLMQNVQDQANRAAWKKNYSALSQVIAQFKYDNGDTLTTNFLDISNFNNTRDKLKPYLQYTKICDRWASFGNCWPSVSKTLDGSPSTFVDLPGFLLTNGASVMIAVLNNDCSGQIGNIKDICGYMPVDVNGMKGPNVQGKDQFSFWITSRGTKPEGTPDDGRDNWCEGSGLGQGCSAKYIMNR